MNLFPFQRRAVDDVRAALRAGHRAVILQLPTGGGKTIVAADIILSALARGHRCLFVAHRLELVEQPYRKLVEAGVPEARLGLRIGGETARRRLGADVQIACIDSLKPGDFAGFRVIVIDECHRACSPSYLARLAERDEGSVVLGLTATPERLDGKGLRQAGFTHIVVGAMPSELIALGRIVEPTVWTVPDDLLPDMRGVGVQGGEFKPADVQKAVGKRELVGAVVEHYGRHGGGYPAIAFAAGIEHSRAVVEMLCNAGIPALHVDGQSGAAARRQALVELRERRVRVVSQCNLWIEGVDEPSVRCAMLLKPTASLTVMLQSVGRAVRAHGGQPAVVLDHAGNVLRHGHPSEDRVYSLEGRSRAAMAHAAVKRCKTCFLIVRAHVDVCPACGAVFEAAATPEPVAYTPQQLRALDPEGYKEYFWRKLWADAYAEGNLPGWVHERYVTRFREPPRFAIPPRPALDDSPAARKRKRAELLVIARVQNKSSSWVDAKMARIFDAPL